MSVVSLGITLLDLSIKGTILLISGSYYVVRRVLYGKEKTVEEILLERLDEQEHELKYLKSKLDILVHENYDECPNKKIINSTVDSDDEEEEEDQLTTGVPICDK